MKEKAPFPPVFNNDERVAGFILEIREAIEASDEADLGQNGPDPEQIGTVLKQIVADPEQIGTDLE